MLPASPLNRPLASKTPPRRPPAFSDRAPEGDVFVFDDSRRHNDFDVIVDFVPGTDKIDLSRTAKFRGADFDELLAAADQVGPKVAIDMGLGTLTLENVDLADLDAADFIF
jgi:hypothetical protein